MTHNRHHAAHPSYAYNTTDSQNSHYEDENIRSACTNIHSPQIRNQSYNYPTYTYYPPYPLHSQLQANIYSHIPTEQNRYEDSATSDIDITTLPKEVQLTDYGTRLKLEGKQEEALEQYILASQENPDYAPAFYNIGVIFSEIQNYDAALEAYNLALEKNPQYVEVYCNIGVIYKNQGQAEKAVHNYKTALSVCPNFKVARNNLAIAYTDLGTQQKTNGDIELAISSYQQALTYNALYPDAYYNLGVAYCELGNIDKSVVCYELGIHFNPTCCEAYNNIGVIYKDRGELERATECFRSALSIDTSFFQTLNNLSVVYTMQGQLDSAYTYIDGALKFNENFGEAQNNFGLMLKEEGRIEEALHHFDESLISSPGARNAGQNRLLALNYRNLHLGDVFNAHKQWGSLFQSSIPMFSSFNISTDRNKVLRIGYFCPDLLAHPKIHLICGILQHNNQNQQKNFCYANILTMSHKTKIAEIAGEWRNIYNRSADDIADMIHNDKIDILIEMSGHMPGNRLAVTAKRPAPIQVSYLGYPNTTGIPCIDYLITDYIIDPLTTHQQFTEKLVRIPNRCFLCYTPPHRPPPITGPPCNKKKYITFGSFDSLSKITPEVVHVWSKILKKVPHSQLLLKCKPFAADCVLNRTIILFTNCGINQEQLCFSCMDTQNLEKLCEYSHVDITLDTWPFNETISTCESLYMGVPVITMAGDRHANNIGKTILHHVGLVDWIANSKDEYIDIAVKFALNIEYLMKLRQNLRGLVQNSISNSWEMTTCLANLFREMWFRYLSSLPQQ